MRSHLLSAPSYSTVVDPASTARPRSSSLPHNVSSGQVTPSEKLSANPTAMPSIMEHSHQTGNSDVFSIVSTQSTHPTHTAPLPRSQSPVPPSHPLTTKPHPPHWVEHSPSPQPQPRPPSPNPFAYVTQQQSELLSNAFMYFIFTMSRALKDPAIQPLIHHLEDHYGGAYPPVGVVPEAPPLSPTASHSFFVGGKDAIHEDDELKREINK